MDSPRPKNVLLLVASLFAGSLQAQAPAGLLTGMPPVGKQSVGIGGAIGAELMMRIPAESYRGLGEYVPPFAHRIRGVVLRLMDSILADGATFDVHCYLEDAQTNLPTIQGFEPPGTSAVASVLGITTPAGILVHQVSVVLPNPVDVPVGRDLFVSVVMHSAGTGVRAMTGSSLPGLFSSSIDSCGPALPVGASYLLLHQAPILQELSTGAAGWQPMFDLLVDGPSGVAVTAIDGALPPTASMFSGLHPDVADPPHQTSRHDVPGYLFRGNGALSAGSPVFLLGSIGPFVGAPWIVLTPGNAVLHLSPATVFPLVTAGADSAGDALLMWPVPQSASLRGVDVTTQAFGFDVGSGAVRGGAAVRQRF